MGFGFSDKDEDEEDTGPKVDFRERDRLIRYGWEEVTIGLRVQSILTGTKGTITDKTEEWNKISISWDNEKTSFFSHKEFYNVIVIQAT